MSGVTWWTAADQAEADLLVHELVTGFFDHRQWCRQPVCPHLAEALKVILEWRRRRELLSIAARLRAAQDLAEWRDAA